MIRHSLRRVRVNTADLTLHCSVHGLLSEDEAQDVLSRSRHATAQSALDTNGRLGWLARAFDWLASRFPARCVA